VGGAPGILYKKQTDTEIPFSGACRRRIMSFCIQEGLDPPHEGPLTDVHQDGWGWWWWWWGWG
jgi:hypothetical protein